MTRRQRCFMEIEVGGVAMGKITMELFNDKCPRTCENFRALCTGEKGIGKTTEKPLHYLSSIFHRVVRGFMIQGGDFSNGNGTGGESIYGGVFPDEDLDTKHDIPFLLSMANRGKDTNGSQFFITTDATPHLDGIHVVFGQIKTGEDIVKYIEGLPVDRMCRPMQDVKITRCGELVLKNKTKSSKKKKKKRNYVSSSESASSDSDEEPTPAKSPCKPAGQEVDKIPESTEKKTGDEGEIDDVDVHPLVTVSKIDPAEIPDIPRNKYLLRGIPESEKIEKSHSSSTGHKTSNSSSSYNQRRNNRYGMVTKSGRHIKGRGKFRFRTPSPSGERSRDRSRSATPPHWRQAQRNTIKLSEYKKIAQSERTNREKEVGNRAAERFSKANGTENGSARDLKRIDSNDKKDKIHDQDIKQSVELVFVKGSRDEEQIEQNKPEEKNDGHEPRQSKKNPESPEQNSAENKEEIEENNKVKSTTKSEEDIVTGQPLDLNALDYEVTEFEQAESEHSNENENEIETEQCTDIATDAADIPSAPVPPELAEQAPEIQATASDTPIESAELACDTKSTELLKKDKTASKPAESSTSSSKRPSQRSSSRTRRSSSRTRRPRRGSSSSDRRRRRSVGRPSRHERERKYDRHDRRRRSRSGERRSNGASSRRRRSSSSGSSSPSPSRRHRTRR